MEKDIRLLESENSLNVYPVFVCWPKEINNKFIATWWINNWLKSKRTWNESNQHNIAVSSSLKWKVGELIEIKVKDVKLKRHRSFCIKCRLFSTFFCQYVLHMCLLMLFFFCCYWLKNLPFSRFSFLCDYSLNTSARMHSAIVVFYYSSFPVFIRFLLCHSDSASFVEHVFSVYFILKTPHRYMRIIMKKKKKKEKSNSNDNQKQRKIMRSRFFPLAWWR